MKTSKTKRLALVLLATIILQCFALPSCGRSEKKGNSTEEKDSIVLLSVENYSNFFYEAITGDIDVRRSALNTKYFVYTLHITFDLKQTADIDNVVIKGKVDVPLPENHLLHVEKKLPLDFTVNINVNGHGETTVYFQHKPGPYGGFSLKDCFLTIESITGNIKLKV